MKQQLVVKKPEELVNMIADWGKTALKLSAILLSRLEAGKTEYSISVSEYQEFLEVKGKDYYDVIDNAADELMNKSFKFEDRFNKKFAKYNFLSRAKYENGVFNVKFDDEFVNYLILIKEKYLRYDLKNILPLKSKYSIRLYEILKDCYEKKKRQQGNEHLILCDFEIDYLRERLKIKPSYTNNDIKKQIIKKAAHELEKHTDISFSFEFKKEGRKFTKILFFVKGKEEKSKKFSFKDFRSFREMVLEKYQDVYLKLDDEVFIVKNTLLYKNLLHKGDKQLDPEEALGYWQKLFKNWGRVNKIDKEQYEKEMKNDLKAKWLKELRQIYGMKIYERYTKNVLGGDEVMKYEIWDVKDVEVKEDGSMGNITLLVVNEAGETRLLIMSLEELKKGISKK